MMRLKAVVLNEVDAGVLERLIAFPLVSVVSNLPIAGWIETRLCGLGIQVRRFPDATGVKTFIGPRLAN